MKKINAIKEYGIQWNLAHVPILIQISHLEAKLMKIYK